MKSIQKLLFTLISVGFAVWIGLKIDWHPFLGASTQGCPFCDEAILKQNTFYVGESSLGLLTHKPAAEGHVLVVPKRHVVRFEDLSDQEIVEIKETIRKVDRMSQRLYGSTGYLLLQKNGREAGQTVPHVHFHFVPRRIGQSHLIYAIQLLTSSYLKPLSPEKMGKMAATCSLAIESPP